jgi:hypothetical protein
VEGASASKHFCRHSNDGIGRFIDPIREFISGNVQHGNAKFKNSYVLTAAEFALEFVSQDGRRQHVVVAGGNVAAGFLKAGSQRFALRV